MTTKALIVGIDGQDGQLLKEHLESKGVEVCGVGAKIHPGLSSWVDITDSIQVAELVKNEKPDEVYHLAAIHHSSEEKEGEATEGFEALYRVNFFSLTYFLEALRLHSPKTRLFFAASSHIYGSPDTEIQNEETPLSPNSVYGMTKADGMLACRLFREKYGLYTVTGILYTHESALRSEKFLSKKVIRSALRIRSGEQKDLVVGNLSAKIDWGYAPDYVRAMHSVLCLKQGGEYIMATGEAHTVGEYVEAVFQQLGLNWKEHVREDSAILARTGPVRIGDPSKLKKAAQWEPSVSFQEMTRLLVRAEVSENKG